MEGRGCGLKNRRLPSQSLSRETSLALKKEEKNQLSFDRSYLRHVTPQIGSGQFDCRARHCGEQSRWRSNHRACKNQNVATILPPFFDFVFEKEPKQEPLKLVCSRHIRIAATRTEKQYGLCVVKIRNDSKTIKQSITDRI